jgi:ubiquinone/menaquinone biosynthesis C-methylase UbiE
MKNQNVCPTALAGSLDNSIRRFFQNPRKLLGKYIKPGMTIMDLGCGPGFFSIEMAKMLNGSGKVIAADLQEGMLLKVNQKISGTALEQQIILHQCQNDRIGIQEKVDFILAFYMIHEVPDQVKLFNELKTILKPEGTMFIVEPKFHVSKSAFEAMVILIEKSGFEIIDRPGITMSRALLIGPKTDRREKETDQ